MSGLRHARCSRGCRSWHSCPSPLEPTHPLRGVYDSKAMSQSACWWWPLQSQMYVRRDRMLHPGQACVIHCWNLACSHYRSAQDFPTLAPVNRRMLCDRLRFGKVALGTLASITSTVELRLNIQKTCSCLSIPQHHRPAVSHLRSFGADQFLKHLSAAFVIGLAFLLQWC